MPAIYGNVRRKRRKLILHDPRPGGHLRMIEEIYHLPKGKKGNHIWEQFDDLEGAKSYASANGLDVHPCGMIACRGSRNIR